MIVGYTTGVFDLFHVGHLNIIKKAKSNCDYLIVGVSTDELVESYKGRKPIISFAERVSILEELKCVDKVVPQLSLDKKDAFYKYNFNITFHGDDWKGSSKYNEIEVFFKSVGVKVVYFPYTDNISTTLIKQKVFDLLSVLSPS